MVVVVVWLWGTPGLLRTTALDGPWVQVNLLLI
ncbi:hypothetical protein FB471_0277 [Amycolatopsis cihanbeyliensis]|uniref:Uncharacterized protein n=1 Tax=Amycolatopsis cihanbeyliensis TaxID=1128664 RepID=A0A542DC44_AMYCI|nr:hypothetical protein FB471_0277 [Amycolatopsis cihanbeyliensis]